MSQQPDLNGPWSLDRGQLRDRDGNALASFPYTHGGPEDRRNGELCALLPQLLVALAQLVDRCERAPILQGNEGMRGPLLAEAKTVLLKAGVESYRPAPGSTAQGWLMYRGVPVVVVVDACNRGFLNDACSDLIAASSARGPD